MYVMLNGLHFYSAKWLAVREQYRFPRSKKKRIRKKWRRNERNWHTVPQRRIYRVGNCIYAHPVVIDELMYWINMKPKIGDAGEG